MIDRRYFFEAATAAGAALAAGAVLGPGAALAQTQDAAPAATQAVKKERPPRLADELVREFVGAAHAKMERTRELLVQEPGLINATWDWGGGDFESALGGASHMGSREIALFLLDHGARLDLFAAAMLGRIEVVRAALTLDPRLLHVPGPHQIPLIAHAEAGGAAAAEVLAYLRSLGA